MRRRFRQRGNFRRFYPTSSKKTDQELLWAITAGRSLNEPAQEVPEPAKYVAKHKFVDFNVNPQIQKNIETKNYKVPTAIQDRAIPEILAGKDIIGIANTGTGKTAAFLIPLVNKVLKDRTQKVLIVAPTRELALQINGQLVEFAGDTFIRSALCIGGASLFNQKRALFAHPNFVIGTPGRIKDLVRQGLLNLGQFNNVVLDEADRMVDIGFIKDIKYFISLLPKARQSLFFSATIPPKVNELLRSFVTDAVTISTKVADTAAGISQDIVKVGNCQKVDKLHDLLISEGFEKVLIFGRTKWGVQKLTDELKSRGFNAGVIHGNKSQSQRQKTLELFKKSKIKILLATDVASRGLDIDDVSHVINYDMPASYDDYIHRIGRTGRADKKGVALTFV